MNSKKDLTDFPGPPDPTWNLVEMLNDAGLELWQAPEGFWAIRAKQALTVRQPVHCMRKRRQEGHA
jgi:hypothetical protein